MPSIRLIIKTGASSLAVMLLAGAALTPLAASALEPCTPQYSDQPGVHSPVGSDAGMFTYQCDGPYAGQWTSAYYVYNPVTGLTTATYSPDYRYDCSTGKWSKAEWDYSPSAGTYNLYRVATSAPAGVGTNCAPTPTGGGAGSSASAAGSGGDINASGPGSTNANNLTGNNDSTINNATNLNMNNTISGVALSGAASVQGNTIGGNAGSGNAQDIANIVNMLQSSSNNLGSGNLVTFVDNIDGDVNGDFLLNPASLASIQGSGPNSTNANNANLNNNLTVNNSLGANINNDIKLDAQSGDAQVSGNNTAGDAKTGNAATIANVVNMINSVVNSGKSFLGVININGDLNGDILLPPDFIDQLLAANVPTVTLTGPSSNNANNTSVNNNTTLTNTNDLGITNNINANAASGNANVSGNTIGGSASSGNAKTSITAFNLTGSSVIGANDLLVFVNVAGGKWVGLIVNAPAGATAAELGGGITSSGPNSDNSNNTTVNNTVNLTNDVKQKINNNITTNAKSGNANVSDNTRGGNASTGDAEGAVNLLNVENSSFNLTGWFGVLFINVFGSWNGSFGINTAAGDPVTHYGGNGGSGGNPVPAAVQAFRFVPHGGSGGSGYDIAPFSGSGGAASESTGGNSSNIDGSVLAAKTLHRPPILAQQLSGKPTHGIGTQAIAIGSLVVLYIIGDAVYTRQRRHP